MQAKHLQVNAITNPVGFDMHTPRLSWRMEAEGFNRRQSACQVQVSLEDTFESCLLDSGKVTTDQSIEWPLEMPLSPMTRYFWRVKVWDENGQPSPWSETAYFETARMDLPWDAQWITSCHDQMALRKCFEAGSAVKKARVYACGVGLYTLFLNGKRVGDEYFNPNFNAYDQWLQYQTFDVTELLKEGSNIIGAWLGNGYYKGRVGWAGIENRAQLYGERCALIAQIEIDYEDGTHQTILTDESWQSKQSPFDRTEIYDGEVFDARRLDENFDGEGWEGTQIIQLDKGLLHARLSLPVRIQQTLPVQQVLTTPEGTTLLDFGQNFSGWVRMRVHAPSGTHIRIRHGEMLTKEGRLYTENLRTAKAELVYISDGRPAEYRPSFTFFGFRYAEVTGLEDVNPDDFVGEVVHSDIPVTGQFDCSDARVNRLFQNAMWSQRDNFVDTPTDCPQRDERMGWTGDAQVFCPTACLNMPAGAFYRKYLYDLAIEQKKIGFVPVVVPYILNRTGSLGGPSNQWGMPTAAWGDAATLMPWDLYLYFGDRDALACQFESMKGWVDYITGSGDVHDGVYTGAHHLGDWLAQDTKDPDNNKGLTPTELIATAYYAWSAEMVRKAAQVLGYSEEEKTYGKLAEDVRAAFLREFVSPSGRVVSETQTAAVTALYMNLLPDHMKPKTVDQLRRRLHTDKMHLTTGFVGTPYLCPSLSENGLNEYAYELLLSEGCPGWMYEVDMGATTIWERWNSQRPDGSFGPVSMNSFNHYAFGSIAEWMYRYMCGINPDENAPGFKHSVLKPLPNSRLSHAKASTLTPYGRLSCGWRIEGDQLIVTAEIPANTMATIHLPDAEGAQMVENGVSIGQTAVLERGSGVWEYAYQFTGETIHKRPEKP